MKKGVSERVNIFRRIWRTLRGKRARRQRARQCPSYHVNIWLAILCLLKEGPECANDMNVKLNLTTGLFLPKMLEGGLVTRSGMIGSPRHHRQYRYAITGTGMRFLEGDRDCLTPYGANGVE